MRKARWQNICNCSFNKENAENILGGLREAVDRLDKYDLDYVREGGFFYKFKLSKLKIGLRKS